MRKFYISIALACLAINACQAPATDTPIADKSDQTLDQATEKNVPDTVKNEALAYDPVEAEREEEAWAKQEAISMDGANANMTFSAFGNEPFWDLEFKGMTARYTTPENIEGIELTVSRKADGEWLRYSGELEGKPFTLSMTLSPCQDDMSGDSFGWTARLQKDGRVFNGCGKRY